MLLPASLELGEAFGEIYLPRHPLLACRSNVGLRPHHGARLVATTSAARLMPKPACEPSPNRAARAVFLRLRRGARERRADGPGCLARLHRDRDSRAGHQAGPARLRRQQPRHEGASRGVPAGDRGGTHPVPGHRAHAPAGPRLAGQIAALAQDGPLGPDLQVVHANCATPAEIAQIRGRPAATVSVSPFSEILIGYGLPRDQRTFWPRGIPTGPSVDTTVLMVMPTCSTIMKVTQGIANARAPGRSSR